MRPAAIIGALATAALVGAGCSNDLDRVAAVEVRQEAPDRVTTGAEYVYSD
jgi:hypothetical protein